MRHSNKLPRPAPIFAPEFDWDTSLNNKTLEPEENLILDLDGFEGPLHLLLILARKQKIDILAISVAELADQYLGFIRNLKTIPFILVADYLVMAAWLVYLKSRMILPKSEPVLANETDPETLARTLAFRLARLQALREAASELNQRPRLGYDTFSRGDRDKTIILNRPALKGDLFALVKAYASLRGRKMTNHHPPSTPQKIYPIEKARQELCLILPSLQTWAAFDDIASEIDAIDQDGRQKPLKDRPGFASLFASSFSAALELFREGRLELQQTEILSPLFVRARTTDEEQARVPLGLLSS